MQDQDLRIVDNAEQEQGVGFTPQNEQESQDVRIVDNQDSEAPAREIASELPEDQGLPAYKDPKILSHLRETRDMEQAMDLSRGNLEFALQETQNVSPQEAKRIADISAQIGLPEDVVKSNLKTAQDIADYNKAVNLFMQKDENNKPRYPKTLEWIKDPKKMKLAQNDQERLVEIERIKYEVESQDDGFFGDIGRSLETGSYQALSLLARVPQGIEALNNAVYGTLAEVKGEEFKPANFVEQLGGDQAANKLDELASISMDPEINKSLLQSYKEGNYSEAMYNTFMQAVQGSPLVAGLVVGGGTLGPVASLGTMGVGSAGAAYEESKDKGYSPATRARSAVAKGAIEVASEAVTLGIAKRAFGKTAKEIIAKVGKEQGKKEIAKGILKATGAVALAGTEEGLSEGVSSAGQDFVDYLAGDKVELSQAGENFFNSFMVGGATGAGIGLAGQVRDNYVKRKYLKDQHKIMDKTAEALEETELKKVSPEMAEDYVRSLDDGKVYLQASKLKDYFQKKMEESQESDEPIDRETMEMEFNDTIQKLGIAEQVEEALITGTDLEIDKAKWTVNYANTDMGKAVKNDLRFSLEGMTENETAGMKQKLNEDLESMREDIEEFHKEENTEQIKNIREVLMTPKADGGVGYSAAGANQYVATLLAGARTMGKQTGETVNQFLERAGFELVNAGKMYQEQEQALQERKFEDLEGEALQMAEDYIAEELSIMAAEISASKAGSRTYQPSEIGGGTDVGKIDSTFPEYFKELKTNKKSFLAAIKRGSGPVYERIKQHAIHRLTEGYKNDHSGENVPNNEFRSLLNKGPYEGAETKFTLFQKRTPQGILLKRNEVPTKDIEDVKSVKLTKANRVYHAKQFANAKTFKTHFTKIFQDWDLTVDSNGFNVKISPKAINTIIDKAYAEAPDLVNRNDNNFKKKYRKHADKMSIIMHLDSFLENSVKISTERGKGGMDTYYAVGKIGNADVVVKFRSDNKNTVQEIMIETLPSNLTTASERDRAEMKEDKVDVSINEFVQRVNRARDTAQPRGTYFQKDEKVAKKALENQVLRKINQDELGFYSKLEDEISKINFKQMPAANLLSQIKKMPGIKKEELNYSGIDLYLESLGKEKISKEDILKFMKDNTLSLKEVVLSDKKQLTMEFADFEQVEFLDEDVDGLVATYELLAPDRFGDDIEYVRVDEIETENGPLIEANINGNVEYSKHGSFQNFIDWFNAEYGFEYGGPTQFGKYTMDGGDNYREVLITLPKNKVNPEIVKRRKEINNRLREIEKEKSEIDIMEPGSATKSDELLEERFRLEDEKRDQERIVNKNVFRSSHFNQENILVHARLNEYIDENGKRVLNMEEDQSDWHQKGKKRGYSDKVDTKKLEKLRSDLTQANTELRDASNEVERKTQELKDDEDFKTKYLYEIQKRVDVQNSNDKKIKDLDSEFEIGISTTDSGLTEERSGEILEEIKALRKQNRELREENRKISEAEDAAIYDMQQKLIKDLEVDALRAKRSRLEDELIANEDIAPDAPFKQTDAWAMLAFKRVLRMAVEEGYDYVTWTPSEVQIQRYEDAITSQVSEINYERKGDRYALDLKDPRGRDVQSPQESYSEKELEENLGKDLTSKIVNGGDRGTLSDTDFKIGGKGMKDVYDRILPKEAGKYISKIDKKAKVSVKKLKLRDLEPGEQRLKYSDADQVKIDELSLKIKDLKKQKSDRFTEVLRLEKEYKKEEKEVISEKINDLMDIRNEIDEVSNPEKYRDIQTDIEALREQRKDLKDGGPSITSDQLSKDLSEEIFKAREALKNIEPIEVSKELKQDVWSIELTDKLRESISGGQPLFQQDDSVKGMFQGMEGRNIITLFQPADKSTPLHELGHFFLNEMQRMVDLGLANEQTIKDLQTLQEFADGEFNVDGVEKIVRGFEQYLKEGKAPSLSLQEAFRTFKTWLTAIYKKVRGLPEIDDDVRAVFDRMLATENEIAQVKRYHDGKESVANLVKGSPAKVKNVQDQEEKATKTAEEKLLAKYMKAYYKAIGGKKQLTAQAKAEIEADPIYMAIEDAKQYGISEQDVLDHAGELELEALKATHRGLVKKKSKKSIGELALEYDFESPFEMIDMFVNALSKGAAVKARTNELVSQKEQEILDGLKEKEGRKGEEELHNDERLDFLLAEHRLLSEQLEKQTQAEDAKIEAKLYRDVARETLMAKSTRMATRYDLYAKTEQKYSNESYEQAKKGNYEKAAIAKRKQIINHIMVQEAVKLRDYKLKAEKKYKTTAFKKRIANIENDYANIASSLVNRYGLNANIFPADKEIANIQSINEALYDQLPEWIEVGLTPTGQTNWRDMTMEEFQILNEALDSIIHSGKDTLLSMKESEYATIGEVVDASLENIEELEDATVYPEHTDKTGLYGWVDEKAVQAKQFVHTLLADSVMFEYLFEELDNYTMHRTGEFGVLRTLFNRGREAEGQFKETVRLKTQEAQEHFDKLNEARERIEKDRGRSFKIDGVPLPDILAETGVDRWTVEKMVSFMLNMGNTHNKEVLENAYGFTPDQVNTITQHFTKEEIQAIQGIWDVTDTLYEPLNKTNFSIHNRNLPKVEAEQVTFIAKDAKTVTLPGGYYPLVFDRNISDTVEKQQEDDMMKDRNKSVLRSQKPKDGMTKNRVGSAHSLPPLLSISVWSRHISDTSRYISHAEFLRDLNRVTSNPDWKKAVRKKVGKKLYSNIRDWVKYQARPERQMNSKWERMLDKQKSMATSMILGLNMGVALKQRLSGLSAQTDLGGQWILKALRDSDLKGSVLGMGTSKMWQEITGKSAYIRAREGSMDREINDIVSNMSPFIKKFNIPGFDRKLSFKDAQDAVFFLIQAHDRAMTGTVWKAAYMKSLDGNKNKMTAEQAEKAAITYADSVVATTQPSSLPIDLNTLQRSEGAMRLFTAFMTWTYKQGNRFGHKYRAWKQGAITTKEYTEHVAYEWLMAPWGATIISSMLLSGEMPEWWEYMTSPAEYGISWIPLLRDVPGAVKYRRGVGDIPAFEGANRFVKTGVTAYQWANGDKEYYDFLWSVGYSMEAMSGIPALKVVKNMNNTRLILNGEK